MIDRLYRLGHHAIIRCHYQNRNICGVCTTHTHGSKRLMSRCIQESNGLPVYINGISTDMLGNTASFLIGNVGLTDRIQKRGLTMVDMPHNTDDRRSGNQSFLCILVFL